MATGTLKPKKANKKSGAQGYTLIEILIVIVIISIAATFAVLTIGHNQNKRMESIGKEITNLILLAEEQAILQPAIISFSIQNHSYQFNRFIDLTKKWETMNDSLLGKHDIPDGIKISVHGTQDNTDEEKNFSIVISPSGDMTPFTILIGNTDEAPRYQITGTATGDITQGWIDEE